MAPLPPIVYVGPSLDPKLVERHLPGAQLMPPVRRADLYRDRMLGFSCFVMLDGVFFHRLAIPPREVLDVIADGAVVIGACSMGAIRAAECWPAGMRGVGTIYRLLRRGSLRSDDEVAVAFGPENPHLLSTVPLVNVRYALSRALRRQELGEPEALRVLAAAESSFYADRNWRSLLEQAGVADPEGKIRRRLAGYDLKGKDAVRALGATARLLRREPGLLERPRASDRPFQPNELTRERSHDAFGPDGEPTLRPKLWEWLHASGRIRRHLDVSGLAAGPEAWTPGEDFPAEAWRHLRELGELDPLAFRYRAITAAAVAARARSLAPGARHVHLAEMEIALAHRFPSWAALRAGFAGPPAQWAAVRAYRDDLALAKAHRDALFGAANSSA